MPKSSIASLKIGEVAQKSGLSVQTICYYADLNLLTATMGRSPKEYRVFSRKLFKLPYSMTKHLLEDKLDQINKQINELLTLKAELQGILSGWQDFPQPIGHQPTICPN